MAGSIEELVTEIDAEKLVVDVMESADGLASETAAEELNVDVIVPASTLAGREEDDAETE